MLCEVLLFIWTSVVLIPKLTSGCAAGNINEIKDERRSLAA